MVDRYRTYRPYRPTPPPRKSRRGLFVLIAVVVLVLGGNFMWHKLSGDTSDTNAVANTKKETGKVIQADPISSTTWNTLSEQVNAAITARPDLDISVAVIDVGTNTKGNYGIQDNFAGASTTKVLTAAAYLHQVENGEASLNQTIGSMTAKQQLKQMINQSNNESWAALNSAVGRGTLESYAHGIGLSSYQQSGNLMTASDEAVLLQKLYSGKLLSSENQQLLLSFMQNTNNEDMIPKVIPGGATVHHKYGQLDGRLHDAAIVDYRNRPIVVVIYTKGAASTNGTEYADRVALIQSLAQTVFQAIYAS